MLNEVVPTCKPHPQAIVEYRRFIVCKKFYSSFSICLLSRCLYLPQLYTQNRVCGVTAIRNSWRQEQAECQFSVWPHLGSCQPQCQQCSERRHQLQRFNSTYVEHTPRSIAITPSDEVPGHDSSVLFGGSVCSIPFVKISYQLENFAQLRISSLIQIYNSWVSRALYIVLYNVALATLRQLVYILIL